MLRETTQNVQNAITEILARFDLQNHLDAERIMQAALASFPDDLEPLEDDELDPDYGNPEEWGLWADRDTYEIGPNLPPDDDTLPDSPLWKAWLTRTTLKD